MSVGDSVAIFFLNPIVSAFLAWPVLGEAVGLAEAGAIICGLGGTLLVGTQPSYSLPRLRSL
jgi:drug/metabolite transporter (DMT)-like permease